MTVVKKALVSYALEQALLDVGGKSMIELVSKKLNSKYNCELNNCYVTPQYINDVLKEACGKKHRKIINAVEENLEEFIETRDIDKFLLKIK
ncbi:MAG: hypothetical protein ACW9W3_01795 [Candidatus Nitrosopumilus sp. bin_68KS]